MNILRLRAYFDPEMTASNHMSDDMDKAYVDNGIININITPMPTRGISDEVRHEYRKKKYEELSNGHIIVHRFSMFREGKNLLQRAFRYFCCSIVEYYQGVHANNIDLVHAGSTPPTQGMLSAIVAKKLSKKYKKKVPFVYNLQDIFPDSMVNAGMIEKGGLIWKIGRIIENYTYRNSDKIIVINESFKRNIMEKGVPENIIEVVPNWVDLDSIMPVKKEDNKLFSELRIDKNKFVVVYAGNLGEAQGANIILEAAEQLKKERNIEFVIFGGGSLFEDIRKRSEKLSNLKLLSLMPKERVSEVYSLGDVALITCKPGTGKAGMPSKAWSIMACNTPIIASFDIQSELSNMLEEANAGICVEPGNANALAKKILEYASREPNTKETARIYALKNASRDVCVKKYLDVLINTYQNSKE